MGDERGSGNESDDLGLLAPGPPRPSAVPPRPVAQAPRPVTLPPRPSSGSAPLAPRPPGTPPPPPIRSLLRSSLTPPPVSVATLPPPSVPPPARPSAVPPAPPSSLPPSVPSISLRPPEGFRSPTPPSGMPSVLPTAVATPSVALSPAARLQEVLGELMRTRKELAEKSSELSKTISERNTLRARLARAEANAHELSSAFRAEAQLRSDFVDAHAASSAALRARVAELEAALASAKAEPKPSEQLGLRRIRGIGPAYERALLGIGITQVAQIAALTPTEIARIAPLIKAQPDRIQRDDWVGQARNLLEASKAR